MAKKQEDKIEKLNAKYEYKGDGELMSDISSSKPLKSTKSFICENCGKKYKTKSGLTNHMKKCETKQDEKIVETKKVETIIKPVKKEPTQKEIFNKMILEGSFILKISGTIIFDSDIDDIMLLSFSDEYFRIGKKEFPYIGLNFKYKK